MSDTDETSALVRRRQEAVETRGLSRRDPYGVPEWDADPEEYEVGPPSELAVAALEPGAERNTVWSMWLSTALGSAPASQAALVESALTTRSDAAMSADMQRRLRPLADQVALLEVEYMSACTKYNEAESATPDPAAWKNPQHLLEAMKVHERRMDRLQRGMRDAHDRWRASLLLLEQSRGALPLPSPSGKDGTAVAVEMTQTGTGTSRVRVAAR